MNQPTNPGHNNTTRNPGHNNTTRIGQAASIIGAATNARNAGYPAPAPHAERLARFFIDHADNPTAQRMWDEVVGTTLSGGGSR